jgi:hypothetical protein
MKHLLLAILLMSCNPYYEAVVIYKGNNFMDLEAMVNEWHYILPRVTINEYDSLVVGDTILIDRTTLRVVR